MYVLISAAPNFVRGKNIYPITEIPESLPAVIFRAEGK